MIGSDRPIETRRKCVAKIVDADGGKFGVHLDIYPEPLDVS